MNVYDFDGTVYRGDSSIDFFAFCVKRHPSIARMIPCILISGIKYKFFHGSLEKFKSTFFRFLPLLPNIEGEVVAFWNSHENRIFEWYLKQKQSDDVVISASPSFLLLPICERLGIKPPIATVIDPHTGTLLGENCKGEEKVSRFLEKYPDVEIQNFYSDSQTDAPLATLAQMAFLVQGDTLQLWNDL